MKLFFTIFIITLCCTSSSAQLNYTENQNLQDNFYSSGINGRQILNKAGIKKEAAFDMITNANNEIVDGALISYSEYDSMGKITGSVYIIMETKL